MAFPYRTHHFLRHINTLLMCSLYRNAKKELSNTLTYFLMQSITELLLELLNPF